MLKLSEKTIAEIGRNVYGEGVRGAVYYHGGHYYDGSGEYLYSNPDTNPPPGSPGATTAPEAEGEPTPSREETLIKLTVKELQALQRSAGVKEEEVITGTGAKAKLVTWLLDNTAE